MQEKDSATVRVVATLIHKEAAAKEKGPCLIVQTQHGQDDAGTAAESSAGGTPMPCMTCIEHTNAWPLAKRRSGAYESGANNQEGSDLVNAITEEQADIIGCAAVVHNAVPATAAAAAPPAAAQATRVPVAT